MKKIRVSTLILTVISLFLTSTSIFANDTVDILDGESLNIHEFKATTATKTADVISGDSAISVDVVTGDIKLVVGVSGESSQQKRIQIQVPNGLELIDAPGVRGLSSVGKVNTKDFTPTEQLLFIGSPTWIPNTLTLPNGSTEYQKSGTLTYALKDEVSGTGSDSLVINLKANTKLYDFSNQQTLDDLVVLYSDTEKSDRKTLTVTLNGERSGTPVVTQSTWDLDLDNVIQVSQRNATYSDGMRYNYTFDLMVPTDSILSGEGIDDATIVDHGDGTKTVKVALTSSYYSNNRVLWTGSIKYPSDSFTDNQRVSVKVSNLDWDEYHLDPANNQVMSVRVASEERHEITGRLRTNAFGMNIVATNQDYLKEYANHNMKLASFKLSNTTNQLPSSPVEVALTFETVLDSVNKVSIPVKDQTHIQSIVVVYEDGSQQNWQSGDGDIIGVRDGLTQVITAPSDKKIKSLNVVYNKINIKSSNVDVTDYVFDIYGNHDLNADTETYSTHTLVARDSVSELEYVSGTAGFVWKNEAFAIDITVPQKDLSKWDDGESIDYKVGHVLITNTKEGASRLPIEIRVDVDSSKDTVSQVYVPASTDFDNIDSFTYKLVDGSELTWNHGEVLPESVTYEDGRLILKQENGTGIESVALKLKKWLAFDPASSVELYGQPIQRDNPYPISNHSITVSEVQGNDNRVTLDTDTTGFTWKEPGTKELELRWPNFNVSKNSVIAGTSFDLKFGFGIGNRSPYMKDIIVAVLLPDDAELSSINVEQYGGRVILGAPETREATDDQMKTAGFEDGVKGKLVIFKLPDNVLLPTGGADTFRVNATIKTSPFTPNRIYPTQWLVQVGTNEHISKVWTWYQNNKIDYSDIFNIGNGGFVAAHHEKQRTQIVKNPQLFIDQSFKKDGESFKTYVPDDHDTVTDLEKNDKGTLKFRVATTIPKETISNYDTYFYLPIPKENQVINGQINPEGPFEFDFKLTGPVQLTSDKKNYKSYEIEYATLANNTEINAASHLNLPFSKNFDEGTNFIRIKMNDLENGDYVDFEVPVQAPNEITERVLYDAWGSIAIGSATGNTFVSFEGNDAKVSYNHPLWNVEFNTNGGLPNVIAQKVEHKDVVTEPVETITKWGYEFAGWYRDELLTEAWNFELNQVVENVQLFAKWVDAKHKVNFEDSDFGLISGILQQEVIHNSYALEEVIATPIKDYEFIGWKYTYVDNEGKTMIGTVSDYKTVNIVNDTTFTAHYVITPSVTATIQNGAVAVGSTIPEAVGDLTHDSYKVDSRTVTLPTSSGIRFQPTDETYFLKSIEIKDPRINKVVMTLPIKSVEQSFTYGAGDVYEGTVSFDIDSQTIELSGVNDSLQVNIVMERVLAEYKIEHYQQTLTGEYELVTTDTQTIENVYAGSLPTEMSPNTYKGFTHALDKTVYTTETSSDSKEPLRIQVDNSLVIKHYYDRVDYDVTFMDGNNTYKTDKVVYGSLIEAPEVPTKYGMNFVEWYRDDSTKTAWNFDTEIVQAATTLRAQWTPKEYAVTFTSNIGGVVTGDTETSVLHDHTIEADITVTSNSQYEFIGWHYSFEDELGEKFEGIIADFKEIQPHGDVVMLAQYAYKPEYYVEAINGYVAIGKEVLEVEEDTSATLSLDSRNEVLPTNIVVSYKTKDENYDLVRAAIKFGDISHGIDIQSSSLQTIEFDSYTVHLIVDKETQTIKINDALYSLNISLEFEPIMTKYTIKHYFENVDGGYGVDGEYLNDGSAKDTVILDPQHYDNYVWNEEKTQYSSSSHDQSSKVISIQADGSLVIQIYYDLIKHSVLLQDQNEILDVKHGTILNLESPKNREGYIFSGWYTNSDFTTLWNMDADQVVSNIVLYELWNKEEEKNNETKIPNNTDEVGTEEKNSQSTEVMTKLPNTGKSDILINVGFVSALLGSFLLMLKRRKRINKDVK